MPRPATRTRGSVAAASQSISSFARVSKGPASLDASIKKSIVAAAPASRKRKAADDEEEHPRLTRRTVSYPPSDDELAGPDPSPVKRTCRRQEPQVLQQHQAVKKVVTRGKKVAKAEPRRSQVAHRPVETTVLAKAKHQGRKVQTKLDGAFKKVEKPARVEETALPPHLAELVDLHRAFVKTILIHIAHSGSGAPVDVKAFLPSVTRSWGKRNVTIDDIRRCIALHTGSSENDASPFSIVDYGRGKICIEHTSSSGAPIVPKTLYARFRANLEGLCRQSDPEAMAVDISLDSLSLKDLPHANIAKASVKDLPPLLARGNLLVEEFQKRPSPKAAPTPTLADSKTSLLDRIRQKELARANGPLPPSSAELRRTAALARVEDVAATISMLSLSTPVSLPRQAFTMAVILERLRDSLRTPISKEEGADCVRLIASEVAPEWLRVVTIGGRDNVVVQRGGQPVDRVIRERVQKLMG